MAARQHPARYQGSVKVTVWLSSRGAKSWICERSAAPLCDFAHFTIQPFRQTVRPDQGDCHAPRQPELHATSHRLRGAVTSWNNAAMMNPAPSAAGGTSDVQRRLRRNPQSAEGGAGDSIDALSPSLLALIHFRLRRDQPHFFGLLDQAIDDTTLLRKRTPRLRHFKKLNTLFRRRRFLSRVDAAVRVFEISVFECFSH